VTLFVSIMDDFPLLVVLSLIGTIEGPFLVVAFGSLGAFGTLATGLLSAASPVPEGASGMATVVASEPFSLAVTCGFSGALLLPPTASIA